MPRRDQPRPPTPAKDLWQLAFAEELARLRSHARTEDGFISRHVHQIASLQWGQHAALDPKVAAQRYHAATPRPKVKRSP